MTNILSRYNTILRGSRALRPPSILYDGNTVGWYDYKKLVTKDGSDFVSAWNDKLGSGHDLLQAVGTNQPKWVDVDGILFDGIDNFMRTAPFTFEQPEQIYIVFKQVTWGNFNRIFDGNLGADGTLRQIGTTPDINVFAGLSGTESSDCALDTFCIARILINGASSELIIDENTPITGDFGALNMNGLTLGANNSGTSAYSHIQVKEMILRKVADTAQDKQDIYDYLKKKIT